MDMGKGVQGMWMGGKDELEWMEAGRGGNRNGIGVKGKGVEWDRVWERKALVEEKWRKAKEVGIGRGDQDER